MPTQHTSSSATKSGSASRNKPAPPKSSAASATDERDEVYGLVSVIYHALQGGETYAKYVQDARAAGDDELVEFFEECRDEESDRADRAKALLAVRIEGHEAESNGEDEDDDEDVEEEK